MIEMLEEGLQPKSINQLVVEIALNNGDTNIYIINSDDFENIKHGEYVLDREFIGAALLVSVRLFLSKNIFGQLRVTQSEPAQYILYKDVYVVNSTSVEIQSHSIAKMKLLPKVDVYQNISILNTIGIQNFLNEFKGKKNG